MANVNQSLALAVNHYSKQFGVDIRIQGTCAYTNGNTITIPRLNINTQPRLAYGYIAHESAHIRYTDFSILQNKDIKDNFFLFNLFNILEDSRIEKIISKHYIGVYENLSLLNDYYEKDWQSFLKNLKNISLYKTILCFIQCIAQSHCQCFASSRSRAVILYTYLKNKIERKTLREITLQAKLTETTQSSEQVYKLSVNLEKIIRKNSNLLKKNSTTTPPQTNKKPQSNSTTTQHQHQPEKTAKEIQKELEEHFELQTKGDKNNITPNKSYSSILEENLNEDSSSREDFGLMNPKICKSGNPNFLKSASENTYALRNNLTRHAKGYVESFGLSSEMGKKINVLKAQRHSLGETQVFKKTIKDENFNTTVQVLVDVSSSMLTTDNQEKTRAEVACEVALNLSLALENIDGIKVGATYFPGNTTEYEIAKKFNERINSNVAGRFDQKPRGSTPLAQAMWHSFTEIVKENASRNIIYIVTDGIPDSVNNTRQAIEFAEKNNIEIYAISIRSAMASQIFKNCVVIKDTQTLYKESFSLFKKLFEKKNKNKTFKNVA